MQSQYYDEEIKCLSKGKLVKRASCISKPNPFLEGDLLHVGVLLAGCHQPPSNIQKMLQSLMVTVAFPILSTTTMMSYASEPK